MMHPDTTQVFLLSDYFHQSANAVGTYVQSNKKTISDEERNWFYDEQIELIQISANLNMLGVSLVFNDVQETIHQLENITAGVNKAVKKALRVQDAINLATSLVSIGTAILASDGKAVAENMLEAAKLLHGLKEKA